MLKKLTITMDEEVYEGLYKVVGPRKISRFLQELARPHVLVKNIEKAYRQMSKDEAREKEALEWSEGLIGDIDETR